MTHGPAFMVPAFLAGFGLYAALIVGIGAQNAFVLRQGLRREHVGPVVLFCATADLVLISLGVIGVGATVAHVPGLTAVLTLGGVLFLGWYGVGAFRRAVRPAAGPAVERSGAPLPLGTALARTAGFTLLNPHVWLDTLLVAAAASAVQSMGGASAFVAGAVLASVVWFVGLGYGARLLAPLFSRPVAWRVLDVVVGATMLANAAGLVRHALT
jgi:L-lysine exporter family protein LysE/ArgO